MVGVLKVLVGKSSRPINNSTIHIKGYKTDLKSGPHQSNGQYQWIFINILNIKIPDLRSELYSLICIVELFQFNSPNISPSPSKLPPGIKGNVCLSNYKQL